MDSQPGVITLTGDNALTIGAMLAVLYLGALLVVQVGKRLTSKGSAKGQNQAQGKR